MNVIKGSTILQVTSHILKHKTENRFPNGLVVLNVGSIEPQGFGEKVSGVRCRASIKYISMS